MNAADASAGEDAMRGLMQTAFIGEPALPELHDVMTTVETLGEGIRHRQRVRTRLAAGVLCVAGFGMVAGIAAVAHSTHSGGASVIAPGGGQAPPPVTTTSLSGSGQSRGTSGGTTSVDP